MSRIQLYAAMNEPVARAFEPFCELDVITDTAEVLDANCVRREIVGKIRGRGLIWYDFLSYWTPVCHAPLKSNGKTYIGVKSLKVNYDAYADFAHLHVEGNNLRLILVEAHRGTLKAWESKCERRTKRVREFLDFVRSGQFTRNDYRELMGHERLEEPHMKQVFTPVEMNDLMKGIEAFPAWKKKTQNEII